MFSAVLILILLTSMTLYAVQVGVFEQRKSANENWQKLSFHAADSGIQTAKNFLTVNAKLAVSDWLPADAGGTDPHWAKCSEASEVTGNTSGTHPCFGEPVPGLRAGTYYYSYSPDSYTTPAGGNLCPPDSADEMPNCWNQFRTDGLGNVNLQETVEIHALLCMLDIDLTKDPVVQGCTTDATLQDSKYFIITLLARGEADCQVNGTNCGAETLIAEKIGSFSPGGDDGGVGAPLTARTNVPLSGTVEIVPNPNGGGVGVPISSWVNVNDSTHLCPAADASDPISPISGSYATCERQEWYGQDTMPTDFKCPTSNCSCDPNSEQMITYASGNDREMGIDIVPDDDFPCDLFEETYGMDWESLKLFTQKHGEILESCDTLDADSEGLYWISGPTCDLKDQIGGNLDAATGKRKTVMLISAAADTKVSAGAEVFGVLMVTDKEVGEGNAEFTGNGHATIYGAAIMDADMEHFNGTFQIVYVEELIDGAFDIPLTGQVAGGWTDFHAAWR